MNNPWNLIKLSDYENHMRSDTIMQLQALNDMMKEQFNDYSVDSAMVLGVAGGNGLEHIDAEKYSIVYGVDVNNEYLQEVKKRFRNLEKTLKCLCIDLITDSSKLPNADLIIADLLIEYIGYECFQSVIKQVNPKYVSCSIQINTDENFVSKSPYLHSFDGLNSIHHRIEPAELIDHMRNMEYYCISTVEYPLPNEKKLFRVDFSKNPEYVG